MSTPDNAWQILTSDAETDVGSYYVTLPADVTHPTRPPNDTFYEEKLKRLDSFENWKKIQPYADPINNTMLTRPLHILHYLIIGYQKYTKFHRL